MILVSEAGRWITVRVIRGVLGPLETMQAFRVLWVRSGSVRMDRREVFKEWLTPAPTTEAWYYMTMMLYKGRTLFDAGCCLEYDELIENWITSYCTVSGTTVS